LIIYKNVDNLSAHYRSGFRGYPPVGSQSHFFTKAKPLYTRAFQLNHTYAHLSLLSI